MREKEKSFHTPSSFRKVKHLTIHPLCGEQLLWIIQILGSLIVKGKKKGLKRGSSEMSSALIDATRENDVPLVTQLIAKGADVYGADNYGRTALFWAAYRGFEECTKLLLEANADVNKFDLLGWNALHVASCNGYVNCVKVEGSFGSLFVLWMKKNNLTFAVQLLIKWDAYVDARTNHRISSLHLAAKEGHLACFEVRRKPLFLSSDLSSFC